MLTRTLLIIFSVYLSQTVSSQSITMPVTRKEGVDPVTHSQKLLSQYRTDFLHEHIPELDESFHIQEIDFKIGTEEGIVISFVNQMNLIYTGPIYFSTEFQGIDTISEFVYDTGSGDLTTTSSLCTRGCSSKYYDHEKSLTAVTHSQVLSTLRYGSATFRGMYTRDTVCIAPIIDLCVHDFKFFEIIRASGF